MANHLSKNSETTITISHFFRGVVSKDLTKSTPFAAEILSDLLQLEVVKSTPNYALAVEQIESTSNTKRRVYDVPFKQIWAIVQSLVAGLPDVTLIIDGLDEADKDTSTEVGNELRALSSLPNTRVVVCFRHHPQVQKMFQDSFKIELTPAAVSDDIRLYVEGEIRRHPIKLKALEKDILETITNSANGMFLWAELMLQRLQSAETHNDQIKYLRDVPPDLYTFYDQILQTPTLSLESLSLRREIFLVLVGLRDALTCYEISFILSLKHDFKIKSKDFGKSVV